MNTPTNYFMKYAAIAALLICFLATDATATVSLLPHITAGTSITDNVDLTTDQEQYDVITTVNPGIECNLTDRSSSIFLSYNPTYAAYTRFPENNVVRHSAILQAKGEIATKTRIEFRNNYLYTEDPMSETDATIRQGRNPYHSNTANLEVINQFGREDSIALGYEYFLLDNQEPTIENRTYQRPSLLMTYWISPSQYAVQWESRYTRSDFEVSENYNDVSGRMRLIRRFGRHIDCYIEYTHEYTDFVADGEDYHVHSPQVGFMWDEQMNSSLSASFGYFYRDNEVSEDDSGIVGSVATFYRWGEDSTFSINGRVGFERSSFGAENLGFSPFYETSGAIGHRISRLVSATISTSYRRSIYTDQIPEREDASWRTAAGLSYQALPWMMLRMDYIFRRLDSDVDINDYIENRGMLSVTLRPPQEVTLSR